MDLSQSSGGLGRPTWPICSQPRMMKNHENRPGPFILLSLPHCARDETVWAYGAADRTWQLAEVFGNTLILSTEDGGQMVFRSSD